MTSKEALNNFNFIIYNCAETGKVELKLQETNYPEPIGEVLLKSFGVIEKDLEVLEIIKANKNIIFSKKTNYENMDADDYFKLKGWLENEQN